MGFNESALIGKWYIRPKSYHHTVMGSLRGGSKGDGYLRHLGEPRGALGNIKEYWRVSSYPALYRIPRYRVGRRPVFRRKGSAYTYQYIAT